MIMNQPRRKQAKQSPFRATSFSLSRQHRSVGILESTLEKDYFLWRRYELGEETFLQMQPEPIYYKDKNGVMQRYTPDGEIIVDRSHYIDEVKYLAESLSEENLDKFAILEPLYAKQNKIFRTITEFDIRLDHRIDNIKQLYPSKLHPAPIKEFEALVKGIRFRHLYMKDAIALCKKRKLPLWVIRRSIAHGLFQTDITKHMTELELTWS